MRIRPITPRSRPELAELEATIIAQRGRISPLYQVLLNSPSMAHGWEQLLSAVRNRNGLDADLRELIILRVAVLNRASYEFQAHIPHAINAGLSEDVVNATRQQVLKTDVFTYPQLQVLELADAMTTEITVLPELHQRLADIFSPQQLVDLFVTVAAYNMVSRFLVAAEIGI